MLHKKDHFLEKQYNIWNEVANSIYKWKRPQTWFQDNKQFFIFSWPIYEGKRPKYPIIFSKSILSINAPYGNIELRDEVSCELDWESELAVVIGNPGIRIKKDDAYNHVFGYTVLNDISARDIQRNHKQFFLGKSLPGACPIGPCIVTKDEIDNPHNLDIFCRVNGQIKQESNTKFQIFDIPSQIEAISKSTYLMPGDIIATGTPSGVGFARKPPEFLKDGDIVECEVEKIGKIINKVIDCSHQ